jgi:hypothetical protein
MSLRIHVLSCAPISANCWSEIDNKLLFRSNFKQNVNQPFALCAITPFITAKKIKVLTSPTVEIISFYIVINIFHRQLSLGLCGKRRGARGAIERRRLLRSLVKRNCAQSADSRKLWRAGLPSPHQLLRESGAEILFAVIRCRAGDISKFADNNSARRTRHVYKIFCLVRKTFSFGAERFDTSAAAVHSRSPTRSVMILHFRLKTPLIFFTLQYFRRCRTDNKLRYRVWPTAKRAVYQTEKKLSHLNIYNMSNFTFDVHQIKLP